MPTKAQKTHKQFMTRSYAAFRDLQKRAKEERKVLNFDLETLRADIREAIDCPDGCCYLGRFGEKVTAKNFSIDHETPTSRGGSHQRRNLAVCSRSANFVKGILTKQEFTILLGALEKMPEEARRDVIGRLKAGAAVVRLRFIGRPRA